MQRAAGRSNYFRNEQFWFQSWCIQKYTRRYRTPAIPNTPIWGRGPASGLRVDVCRRARNRQCVASAQVRRNRRQPRADAGRCVAAVVEGRHRTGPRPAPRAHSREPKPLQNTDRRVDPEADPPLDEAEGRIARLHVPFIPR